MIRALSLLIVVCATAMATIMHAQVPSASKLEVFVEFTGDSVSFNPMDSSSTFADDSIHVTLLILLPSGTPPAAFSIKAGTTAGGTDLAAKDFIYDVSGVLSDGTSYRREGNAVYLGIGSYYGVSTIYAEVKLKDGAGAQSTAVLASIE